VVAGIRIDELLAIGRGRLSASGSARLDAELLLAHVLRVTRAVFYAHPDELVAWDRRCDYESLIMKRAAGYPLAYLTGQQEFWSTELAVNRHTLIPRPETECLVETALELIPAQASLDILDLGTGSGAIAIAVAGERPKCRLLATDVDVESLATAEANARRHRRANIRFKQSDWYAGLALDAFDFILCNPPYVDSGYPGFVHGEIRFEPRLALDGGHRGLEIISHIVPASTRHLRPGGVLILEHGHDQGGSVRQLLTWHRYSDCRTRRDYSGQDRISLARWP
jgi:release factor glutamine methyltransferase